MDKKKRGVITVEAALIMPVIIGTLFLIYSLAMVQYNNMIARVEAVRVANRVALNWNSIGGTTNNILSEELKPTVYYGETGATTGKTGKNALASANYREHNPYRSFLELFTTSRTKTTNMKNYLQKKMGELVKTENGMECTTTSDIGNDKGYHIFNRYVEVTVNNTYSNPIFGMLNGMGFHVQEGYSVTAKAKLTEPAEFVRNISFIEYIWRRKNENKS